MSSNKVCPFFSLNPFPLHPHLSLTTFLSLPPLQWAPHRAESSVAVLSWKAQRGKGDPGGYIAYSATKPLEWEGERENGVWGFKQGEHNSKKHVKISKDQKVLIKANICVPENHHVVVCFCWECINILQWCYYLETCSWTKVSSFVPASGITNHGFWVNWSINGASFHPLTSCLTLALKGTVQHFWKYTRLLFLSLPRWKHA